MEGMGAIEGPQGPQGPQGPHRFTQRILDSPQTLVHANFKCQISTFNYRSIWYIHSKETLTHAHPAHKKTATSGLQTQTHTHTHTHRLTWWYRVHLSERAPTCTWEGCCRSGDGVAPWNGRYACVHRGLSVRVSVQPLG